MVPKVDTFARDISEEIKHKEASLADIATASNDIGNSPDEASPLENKSSKIFFAAIGFLAVGVIALIAFIYYYFTALSIPEEPIPSTQVEATTTKASNLSTLSVTLNDNIGRHVSRVEKRDTGYVLTLSSYSPVFAYITRKETDYVYQLLDTISPQAAEKLEAQAPPTPVTEATSTATSSVVTASSTVVATSTQGLSAEEDEPAWSNVTLSNVNIRTFSEDGRTLAYSFISTEKLVIAATAEEVLAIKNAILR
jgi:hypothetical protein